MRPVSILLLRCPYQVLWQEAIGNLLLRGSQKSQKRGYPGRVLKDGWKSAIRSFVYLYVHTCVSLNATVCMWRLHDSLWDLAFSYHPCVSRGCNSVVRAGSRHFYLMNHLISPGSDFSQHYYQVHSMQGYRASLVSFSAVTASGQWGLDATVTEWCSSGGALGSLGGLENGDSEEEMLAERRFS